MRRVSAFLFLTFVLVAACGDNGDNGGNGGNGGPNPPPPVTLYVRESGDDDATGKSPDEAFRTVARAVQFLAPGVTVIVGPGLYEGEIEITGFEETTEQAPIELIADPNGEMTSDAPGEVIIDADGGPYAIRVSRTPFVLIDGFIVVGAKADETGIHVRSRSSNVTIRNCVISNASPVDAIRVQNSNDILIFNNLIFDNRRGIRLADGSQNARIINNTIVGNQRDGISIGGVNELNEPASGATVVNNVIQSAGNNVSIFVDDGPPSPRDGYTGDFNLAFAPDLAEQEKTYRPIDIRGENDVNEDALFVDEAAGDFRLLSGSPARDAGTGSIGADLTDALFDRSTSMDEGRDEPPVDMGYHYPIPPP